MVFWFCGIMVKLILKKVLSDCNPIHSIANSTSLPNFHKTTIPIQLLKIHVNTY